MVQEKLAGSSVFIGKSQIRWTCWVTFNRLSRRLPEVPVLKLYLGWVSHGDRQPSARSCFGLGPFVPAVDDVYDIFFPATQRRGDGLSERELDRSTSLQARAQIDLFLVFRRYPGSSHRLGYELCGVAATTILR